MIEITFEAKLDLIIEYWIFFLAFSNILNNFLVTFFNLLKLIWKNQSRIRFYFILKNKYFLSILNIYYLDLHLNKIKCFQNLNLPFVTNKHMLKFQHIQIKKIK